MSKSKSKGKLISILVLVFILVNVNTVAFGFWDLAQNHDSRIIQLGDRAEITVTAVAKTDKKLVPVGAFKTADEADEIIIDYTVTCTKQGRLYAVINEDSIKIGNGNHPFNSLAVLQIYTGTNEFGNTKNLEITEPFENFNQQTGLYSVTVYIRVIIVAPENQSDYQAAYEALRNQTISFTVTFRALENLK